MKRKKEERIYRTIDFWSYDIYGGYCVEAVNSFGEGSQERYFRSGDLSEAGAYFDELVDLFEQSNNHAMIVLIERNGDGVEAYIAKKEI